MVYQVNDTVLYGNQGVCKITEIAEQNFNGSSVQYYSLRPVNDEKSLIFVPIDNDVLTAKMRRILSTQEIHTLIHTLPDQSDMEWIENEGLRREKYREILIRGDRTELIKMIKALSLHQQTQKDNGKKLHVADERFLKDAEKMLYEEFAHVLNIKREQVLPFIMEQIQVEEKE